MAAFLYKPLLRNLKLDVLQLQTKPLFLSSVLKGLIHDEEKHYFILKMPNG